MYKDAVKDIFIYYQSRGYSKIDIKNKVYSNWVDQTNKPYKEQRYYLNLIYKLIDSL